MNTQINATSQTVTSALTTAENYLQLFANHANFLQKMVVAFGNDFNTQNALGLKSDWLLGDFSVIPPIEIRDSAEINGANGAFAGDKNRIYLSREFLTANAGDVEAVATVLLEEIGHAVDWELNSVDGLGDEGAIFSHLVRGDVLSEEYLQELRVEDDSATVRLDGEVINIEQANFTGNFEGASEGLKNLYKFLQPAINFEVYSNEFPIFGNALGKGEQQETQFIAEAERNIQEFDESTSDPSLFQQALAQAFGTGGLGWLQDLNNDGKADEKDVKIALDESDDIKFDLKLKPKIEAFKTDIESDFGLPGLGLNIAGETEVKFDVELNLGVGYHKDKGFYFETSNNDELTINLDATLPNLSATGELGFLQIKADDNSSSFKGELAVNFQDADSNPSDNRIYATDFDSIINVGDFGDFIDAKLDGGADINLGIETSFNGSAKLPSISSELNLDWQFNNAEADPDKKEEFGDLPEIGFNNVQLDMGTFFNDFVGPTLENVKTITEPIQPVIDILTTPIDLKVIQFTLLDLAETISKDFDQEDKEFIESIAQTVQLINLIPTDSDLKLDLGSVKLPKIDVRKEDLQKLVDNDFDITKIADSVDKQVAKDEDAKRFITSLNKIPGEGLKFPIIDDPMTAFKLLMNQSDVNLFTYRIIKV